MTSSRSTCASLAAAVAAFAAIALLALPAGASAKPKPLVLPGSFSLEARLPRSHGYSLRIASLGHRWIRLQAGKGLTSVTYTVRGRANRNRLDADFGRFGHVALRFHGAVAPLPDESFEICRGRPTRRLVGTLSGQLRFRGEDGFVAVATHRVKAVSTRSFKSVCALPSRRPQRRVDSLGVRLARAADDPGIEVDVLSARGRSHGHRVELVAVKTVPDLLSLAAASESETVGRVRVQRTAIGFLGEKSFVLEEPEAGLETATLRLPKPVFHGKGEYAKGSGGTPSWTGSLRASLPAVGPVSLTGPGFHASLCRAYTAPQIEDCFDDFAQGSGSHSQAFADARLSWSR